MDYMIHPSSKIQLLEYEKQLQQLRLLLPAVKNCNNRALKHDYILKGFSPLEEYQSKLDYDIAGNEKELDMDPMKILMRIYPKCDKLLAVINEKKPSPKYKKSSRNIALQSILGSKS